MKCAYYQKVKPSKEADQLVAKYAKEYFDNKLSDLAAKEYIMKNSWDEEDYKAKLKKYKETGELPEKLF